jgi:hypothetical protein
MLAAQETASDGVRDHRWLKPNQELDWVAQHRFGVEGDGVHRSAAQNGPGESAVLRPKPDAKSLIL